MNNHPTGRLDLENNKFRNSIKPYCRLNPGEVWHDPEGRHMIACGDALDQSFVSSLFEKEKATLAVHDPPYNLIAFARQSVDEFVRWCREWVDQTGRVLHPDSSLYIWLGADQNDHYRPLPEFMQMMAKSGFDSRSFITMRNQRGYGTQKNWMAIRQELMYYTRGKPMFSVQYTDIPKILKGYYKTIDGEMTENLQRSKSPNIRAGNVWVDIQQVFYRMVENVNGCYAQKPLKAIERIINASSVQNDIVTDFFAHSGTTLLACERLGRRCITFDIDPIFAEVTIRRLEHFRTTGATGWQRGHPFEKELGEYSSEKQTEPVESTGCQVQTRLDLTK